MDEQRAPAAGGEGDGVSMFERKSPLSGRSEHFPIALLRSGS